MQANDKIEIGNILSFDVYGSNILGTNFEDLKVVGIFDKGTADIWIDTNSLHANLYAFLPDGTPRDPNGYQYVKLESKDKKTIVLGIPWIKEDTVKISAKGKLTLTMNDMTSDDAEIVRKAIASVGYRINKLELK